MKIVVIIGSSFEDPNPAAEIFRALQAMLLIIIGSSFEDPNPIRLPIVVEGKVAIIGSSFEDPKDVLVDAFIDVAIIGSPFEDPKIPVAKEVLDPFGVTLQSSDLLSRIPSHGRGCRLRVQVCVAIIGSPFEDPKKVLTRFVRLSSRSLQSSDLLSRIPSLPPRRKSSACISLQSLDLLSRIPRWYSPDRR